MKGALFLLASLWRQAWQHYGIDKAPRPEYGIGARLYNKGAVPTETMASNGSADPSFDPAETLDPPPSPDPALSLNPEFDFPEAAPCSFDDPDGDVFIS